MAAPSDPAPSQAAPAIPPMAESSSDSVRNWLVMWRRVAPSARRRPISDLRSITLITITFAIPTPPTSNATAPSPSRSEVKAPSAAALASVRAAVKPM